MEIPTRQRPEAEIDASTKWRIDPNHSTIGFAVKHMMFATVHGRFNDFTGTILFDQVHVERSGVDVTIQSASVDTGIDSRDTDLRSARFFDAETYSQMTFSSTSVAGHGERFIIDGDLTIKGITCPISLETEYRGSGINPSGVEVAGFEATGKLNRKDFGLNWNQTLESGGVLVSDEVKIAITLQANRFTS
jgi:polyisoprenoid-binding protein YceI